MILFNRTRLSKSQMIFLMLIFNTYTKYILITYIGTTV